MHRTDWPRHCAGRTRLSGGPLAFRRQEGSAARIGSTLSITDVARGSSATDGHPPCGQPQGPRRRCDARGPPGRRCSPWAAQAPGALRCPSEGRRPGPDPGPGSAPPALMSGPPGAVLLWLPGRTRGWCRSTSGTRPTRSPPTSTATSLRCWRGRRRTGSTRRSSGDGCCARGDGCTGCCRRSRGGAPFPVAPPLTCTSLVGLTGFEPATP